MVYSFGMPTGQRSRNIKTRLTRVGLASILLISNLLLHALSSAAAGLYQAKADSIVILKKEHTMELLTGGKVIRTYKVALGQGGLAPKEREGDARTPEGHFVIDAKNEHSKYHKALHVSYPSTEDRKRAARLGVSPGGAIMIHGLPEGKAWVGARHRLFDWTLGCVAVTNEEIDEVWTLVPVGTPVEIRP